MKIDSTIQNKEKNAKQAVESKAKECVVGIIITVLGTIGIVNTLMDALEFELGARLIIFLAIVVISAIWTLEISSTKNLKLSLGIGLAIICVLMFVTWSTLYESFCGIIDECIWDFEWYNSAFEDGWTWALIMFSAVVVYLVALNVVKLRSMILAIAQILPLIALFVTVSPIPSVFSLLMCITYVVGIAALRRDETYIHSAVMVMGVSCVVGLVCMCFINDDNYESPQIFDTIFYKIEDFFAGIDTIGTNEEQARGDDGDGNSNSSEGSIGIGDYTLFGTTKLGEIDNLKYSDSVMIVADVINTGRSQYIPLYYGTTYYENKNSWRVVNASKEAEQHTGDITFCMLQMVQSSPKMMAYVAGSEKNYRKNVNCYQYSYKRTDSSDETAVYKGFIYEVSDSYFSKFYDIAVKNVKLEAGENRFGYTQDSFNRTYESKHNTICNGSYGNYLKVDNGVKGCINELNGFSTVVTAKNDVEATIMSIKRVKDYLKVNCKYTLSPGKVPEGADLVQYFLTDSKQGYCTYFASAATLMFREMGIPARYVEGFVLTPEQIEAGMKISCKDQWYAETVDGGPKKTLTGYQVQVKDSSAHAWVEVFMPGYGWLTVEVTPSYVEEGLGGTQHEDYEPKDDEQGETETESETASKDDTETSKSESEDEDDTESTEETPTVDANKGDSDKEKPKVDWWNVLVALAVIIAISVVVARHTLKYKKYQKCLRSSDIVTVYEMLERFFTVTGFGKVDNITYEEYAKNLEEQEEVFKVHHFVKITDIALKVRFGGDGIKVSEDDIKMACRQLRGIREDLLHQMPTRKRILYTHFKIM